VSWSFSINGLQYLYPFFIYLTLELYICIQESALIWNKTTVISIQAETVREQTEQITVDMDEIERRLRELEQQADEDERLAREVGVCGS